MQRRNHFLIAVFVASGIAGRNTLRHFVSHHGLEKPAKRHLLRHDNATLAHRGRLRPLLAAFADNPADGIAMPEDLLEIAWSSAGHDAARTTALPCDRHLKPSLARVLAAVDKELRQVTLVAPQPAAWWQLPRRGILRHPS